jgi:hypothetical protein
MAPNFKCNGVESESALTTTGYYYPVTVPDFGK